MFLQISGVLNIEKSTCSWKHGSNTLQIFSKLELFIHQKDSFGNIVPEMHPFDAQVVGTASELSIPVNLMMEAVAPGVQLISFNVVQSGEFALTVFDTERKRRVSNTAYKFDVFVGTQLYILFSFLKKVSSYIVSCRDKWKEMMNWRVSRWIIFNGFIGYEA